MKRSPLSPAYDDFHVFENFPFFAYQNLLDEYGLYFKKQCYLPAVRSEMVCLTSMIKKDYFVRK